MRNITLLYKFTRRVLPEAWKLSEEISAMFMGKQHPEDSLDLCCFSLYALYPGLDAKNALSFVTALYGLASNLESLCLKNRVNDEASVRRLYPALQDAIDPERTSYGYRLGYSMDGGIQLRKLVDQCRLGITALPSYKLVTGKMKKYVQLYIDLQTYRYLPSVVRNEYIEAWADCYRKRYRDISCMEFSAAAGSLIGVCAMFAAANDPKLIPGEVAALDEALFPWTCGLHKLLDAYVTARETVLTEQMNFTSSYDNLRICEERLRYFADRASFFYAGLKNREFNNFMLNCLLSLYLSDSRASFGMYRLASKNIIKSRPDPAGLYWNTCRLLRRISVL